jgi:hypothetical protein
LLQEEFDPKNYTTPDAKLNGVIQQNLRQIQDEILEQAPTLNYNDLYALANKKLSPLLSVKAAATARLADEQKKLELAQKQFPEYDYLRMSNDLGDGLVTDFFQKNEEGSYSPLAPAQFGNSGSLQSLMADETGKYIRSYDPLFNFFGEAIKPDKGGQNISASQQREHKGVRELQQYKGSISPFYELNGTPDADGFLPNGDTPQIRLKTEDLPVRGSDGTFLKAIPQEQLDYITTDASRAKLLNTIWAQNRPGNIKPGSPEDNMLQRNWLTKFIPEHDPSYLAPMEKQSNAAILNRIQLGFPPNAAGGADATAINDVFGEISTKIATKKSGLPLNELSPIGQGEMVKFANSIAAKGTDDEGKPIPFTNADIAIWKDGNNIYLVKAAEGKYIKGTNGKPQVIAPLNFTNVNLPVNTSQKQKQVILQGQNPPNQKQQYKGVPPGGF